jgi:hypothetical protein
MTDLQKISIIRDFVKYCYANMEIRNSPVISITLYVKIVTQSSPTHGITILIKSKAAPNVTPQEGKNVL